MEINGKVWKDKKFWLAEIPEMIKDAVELFVDDPNFLVDVDIIGNELFLSTNDTEKLIALILKRQFFLNYDARMVRQAHHERLLFILSRST